MVLVKFFNEDVKNQVLWNSKKETKFVKTLVFFRNVNCFHILVMLVLCLSQAKLLSPLCFSCFLLVAPTTASLVDISFVAPRTTDVSVLLSPSLVLFLSSSTFTPLLSSTSLPCTSFECMAVYLAFVETASVLEDSPGINLPCLCQATDQQFTGHQLLGLLGACLTGVLCVWQGKAFTAGVVWALNTKKRGKYIRNSYIMSFHCLNYNKLFSVILLTVSFLFANMMPFGTWVDMIILESVKQMCCSKDETESFDIYV